MIEIFAIVFFSKKIRTIAEQKNINPSKWIWRLILTWFGVEILSVVLYVVITGDDLENIVLIFIPAMALAAASAFYTVKQLEKEPEVLLDNIKIDQTTSIRQVVIKKTQI